MEAQLQAMLASSRERIAELEVKIAELMHSHRVIYECIHRAQKERQYLENIEEAAVAILKGEYPEVPL